MRADRELGIPEASDDPLTQTISSLFLLPRHGDRKLRDRYWVFVSEPSLPAHLSVCALPLQRARTPEPHEILDERRVGARLPRRGLSLGPSVCQSH